MIWQVDLKRASAIDRKEAVLLAGELPTKHAL